MGDEMKAEAIELTITACEKFAQNYEVRIMLEEGLDPNLIPGLLTPPASSQVGKGVNGQKVWYLLARGHRGGLWI